jgi:hypothetical protein
LEREPRRGIDEALAALIGMLALAGALEFGLGGRDVAGKPLSDACDAGRQQAKAKAAPDGPARGAVRFQHDRRTQKDDAPRKDGSCRPCRK